MQKRNKYWSGWIKNARKELGLTQIELAREFAKREGEKSLNTVSKERVSKVEHGATTLSLAMYFEICEMLIEKRYQERQEQAEQNGKFYKAPDILKGEWWDILKWYEEYEALSDQQGSTEAYLFANKQIEILRKEIEQKEKYIEDIHRDIADKQKKITELETKLEREKDNNLKLKQKNKLSDNSIAHINEALEKELRNNEIMLENALSDKKKLESKIKTYEKEKEKYLKSSDGQLSFFEQEISDSEKVKILINLLIENNIEVPEECKF